MTSMEEAKHSLVLRNLSLKVKTCVTSKTPCCFLFYVWISCLKAECSTWLIKSEQILKHKALYTCRLCKPLQNWSCYTKWLRINPTRHASRSGHKLKQKHVHYCWEVKTACGLKISSKHQTHLTTSDWMKTNLQTLWFVTISVDHLRVQIRAKIYAKLL